MRRTTAVAVTLAITLCTFCVTAHSQTENCPLYDQIVNNNPSSCLLTYGWNSISGNPNLPATLVTCNRYGVPFGTFGVVLTPSCGSAPATICLNCLTAGHPINLSTGNTFIVQSDVRVPGLGGGLALGRTWNSMLPALQSTYPFMFGVSWRSNYEERLIPNSGDGYVKYLRSDGSVWSFAATTGGGAPNVYKVAAPANDVTTTITNGSPSWTVTFQSGEKRLFNASNGFLTSIIDRNGNATQLSYDSSNRLASVTDPAARHLTFGYSGASTLVSTVTSDVGLTLSYLYDTQGRLTQVTKQDNTAISFAYDAQNRITSVTDANGKILESHTYDPSGRGLTSSRANGVDSVTVTYPQ